MNTPTQNLTIHHDSKKWSTEIEGEIGEILVDGKRMNDVHVLTEKVASMTKTIKIMAITALALCAFCVVCSIFVTQWLLANDSAIQRLLLTSSKDYDKMVEESASWRSHQRQRAYVHLEEFHGLHWDEGMMDWVNHSIVKAEAKKGNHRATDGQRQSRTQ